MIPQVVASERGLAQTNVAVSYTHLDLVLNIKKLAPNVEVILLTAHGNIPDGVQAVSYTHLPMLRQKSMVIPDLPVHAHGWIRLTNWFMSFLATGFIRMLPDVYKRQFYAYSS